jgi:ABC-type nickel/cobalt efflux system permease component RcnA
MHMISATLDLDTAKNLASGVSIGSAVLAVLMLIIVKNMVMRVVTMVLFLALGFMSYSQRANITDCAKKVQATAGQSAVSCTFFGQDVEVPALP